MKPLIFISVLYLLLPGLIQADAVPEIIINEIAWMGTLTSANDEWIELYNQTESAISIEGWKLKAADGSPQISLTGEIPAQSFWLLERTDDSSVLNINADQIYTGALNNSGETLELYNNTGELIDSVKVNNGWPSGDNTTKQTMERRDNESWQTSREAGGTPKAKNSAPAGETAPILSPSSPIGQPETTIEQKEPEKGNVSEELAAVGEQIPQAKGASVMVFLVATGLAVFSGATILMLKKGLK